MAGPLGLYAALIPAILVLAPAAAGASTGKAATTAVPTKVTLFYFFPEGFSSRIAASVSRSLGRALRSNRRLEVKDSDQLLAAYAGDMPSDAIDAAEKELQNALAALTGGDFRNAATQLETTIPKLEALIAFIKKRRLAHAILSLGVCQAALGKRALAADTFRDLLAWRPGARYDLDTYPSKFVGLFEGARKKAKRLPRGSAVLSTDPPGAKAYVDGRYLGVTPTTAYGLSSGRHYATFKKDGFIKSGLPIAVSAREQRSYSLPLKRSEKYLLLKQTIAQARQGLGKSTASAAMVDLRTVLFIDQVIFAEVESVDAATTLTLHLYDLRSKLRLNLAKFRFEKVSNSKLADAAQLLYLNVRYDGGVDAPPDPAPPPPKTRRAFYARWWFWTAVAAGAAAIVVPIVVLSSGSEGCPDGNRCLSISN